MNKKLAALLILIVTQVMLSCEESKSDDIDPQVLIGSPLHGSTVYEHVPILVSIKNANSIKNVTYFIDDSLHFVDTESPYRYDWVTNGYVDSSKHAVRVVAYDNSDDIIGFYAIDLTVDNSLARPTQLEIFPISYQDGSFAITWTASPDADFATYELYESQLRDMSERNLIYSSENRADTMRIVLAVSEPEKRYYQVLAKDTWGLHTESAVQAGSSYHVFMRFFGGDGLDIGYDLALTSDGGYILAGLNRTIDAGGGNGWIIKTDSNGDELWNQSIGTEFHDYFRSIKQIADGGYVLTGLSHHYAWLVKTDSQGNEEWSKQLGNYFQSVGYSVIQTTDGGFLVAGCTNCAGSNSVESDVLLVKTDSQGNEEWLKTFGGNNGQKGSSVQQTNDGGFIITGNNVLHAWLIKTDDTGNEEWSTTFDRGFSSSGNSVQATRDGGFAISGYISSDYYESDIWLIKTGSDGVEEWDATFGDTLDWGSLPEHAYSLQQTRDDGFIMAGCYDCNDSYGDLFLVKANSQGTEQWTRRYDISQRWSEVGHSVKQTADDGFIIVGKRQDTQGKLSILLLKTDPDGEFLKVDS